LRQIFQSLENGKTFIADLPAPSIRDGEILIRSKKSLISAGTEKMLKEFGQSNLIDKALNNPDKVREVVNKLKNDGFFSTIEAINSKLDNPIPLGYCNVGVVEEIGKETKDFKVGDRVVSNGYHAGFVSVPANLCAKIPDNVSDDEAVFTVLGAIGLQGVRLSKPTFGEIFFVSGLGVIGLITSQILISNGCRVIGYDPDEKRCKEASKIGIETYSLEENANISKFLNVYTNGNGVDGVIVTASTKSNVPIEIAAKICRKRGRIILVGVSGLNLNRDLFYQKELTFQVSCSYGPGRYDKSYELDGNDYPIGFVRWTEQRNFKAILYALSTKKIKTEKLISHKFYIDEALKAYELIEKGSDYLGIVIEYPNEPSPNEKVLTIEKTNKTKTKEKNNFSKEINLSFIGAGNYASRVLIPAFSKTEANFESLFSRSSKEHLKISKKFKFNQLTTEIETILKKDKSNAVIISTRHDSHYFYLKSCLNANKNIFIEKPLCINLTELAEIKNLYGSFEDNQHKPIIMVGFNRRYAPLVKELKIMLDLINEHKSFIYTCNAGFISEDNWIQDPKVGGGRLIGEACHFVDLLVYLSGSKIKNLEVIEMKDNKMCPDTFSINLSFVDGSIGSIHYFSNGNFSFPKERLEVFCGGTIFKLDNFKKLSAWGFPNFTKRRLLKQDKGQKNCVNEFISSIKNKKSPINFEEIIHVHQKILEAKE